ncbi:MAG: flagellar biosynthetic protein FliO [Syntrophomonas sp.]|uniref:flagellar biosynthetic protein FliO n=1 Tax=Syntrophomonas sp. TaxID=2053627 RepID=UPI002627FD61|nr:flagellar biosynthetic protein FliO [Syntrophomonas sp.]MDD2511180.1 flagellar biosynthetic protein FliO [Syntrophomonas sp.]MDD3879737.1 flagellar biosynthetic protein FliO [Syntrophomonas sp.]MDD4627355.1 flagellar biosynthetic protein FliO [Syntrophomonas sp.]
MIVWRKRIPSLVILVLLMVVMLAGNASAIDNMSDLNQELDKEIQSSDRSPSLWLDFLKLIVILGLIIAAAWSVIRIFGKQVNQKMQGSWLHVVDEVILGQNRGIVLCEIGEKLYAVGVTDHSISFLFEVDNPKLQEEISQIDFPPEDSLAGAGLSELKKRLAAFGRKNSKPGRKDFSLLMGEQARRLEQLSYKSMEEKRLGSKRSDENED